MLWAFAAAGATGVLLGLWFRVAALAAASGLIAVVCLSAALYAGTGLIPALLFTFASLVALQLGYLVGVVLSYTWARMMVSSADADVFGDGEPPSGTRRR